MFECGQVLKANTREKNKMSREQLLVFSRKKTKQNKTMKDGGRRQGGRRKKKHKHRNGPGVGGGSSGVAFFYPPTLVWIERHDMCSTGSSTLPWTFWREKQNKNVLKFVTQEIWECVRWALFNLLLLTNDQKGQRAQAALHVSRPRVVLPHARKTKLTRPTCRVKNTHHISKQHRNISIRQLKTFKKVSSVWGQPHLETVKVFTRRPKSFRRKHSFKMSCYETMWRTSDGLQTFQWGGPSPAPGGPVGGVWAHVLHDAKTKNLQSINQRQDLVCDCLASKQIHLARKGDGESWWTWYTESWRNREKEKQKTPSERSPKVGGTVNPVAGESWEGIYRWKGTEEKQGEKHTFSDIYLPYVAPQHPTPTPPPTPKKRNFSHILTRFSLRFNKAAEGPCP